MSNDRIDPNDFEAIARRYAELQAQRAAASDEPIAPTASRTNTGGGANIGHGVRVGNGHFIGRDYIQHLTQIVQSGEDAEAVKNTIALYLHNLSTQLAGLRLGEIDGSIDPTRREPLQLGDVYVPLNTTLLFAQHHTLGERLSQGQHAHDERHQASFLTRPVTALEVLAKHSTLTLLGKPGSGKSSFGARVLLALAEIWRGHAGEIVHLGNDERIAGLFPIRVMLRQFAEQLPAGDAPARAGDLWDFIGRELHASGIGLNAGDHRFVQRLAMQHGALVVFDGLDECGSPARRARVRAAVDEFISTHRKRSCFVLTARPYAWPDGPDSARGVYALADFDEAQIEQFIGAWYNAVRQHRWCSPAEAERKRNDLLQARHRHDLRELAPNPLLLTLMALLHTHRGHLPEDRVDLYHESVELLLLRWNQNSGADQALRDQLGMPQLKLSDVRVALQKLAFQVHEESAGREGAMDIDEGRLLNTLRPLLQHSHDKAALVADYIERRAGLLLGQGERDGQRQFTFPHRTFQEYLAACHLAASPDFTHECLRLARANPEHWAVVLPLAARSAGAERGASAADELIGSRDVKTFPGAATPDDWTLAGLAGAQLQELGAAALSASPRTQAILDRVRGWLIAALPVHPTDGGLRAPQRARIGDLLADLGDPRFDPERWYLPADDMLGFVHIDADPGFLIGTRKSDRKRIAAAIGDDVDKDEINDQCTPSPEFHIARYPVTVAQFRAYLHDAKADPGDPDALRDPDNRPVRWIGWAEAVAYADWLDRTLRNAPELASHPLARLVREHGWQVALPSELEWEKAARGGLIGQAFAWGDDADSERANYHDSGIDDSSACGCFPANGYDLHDMLGNLWEWTRSAYRPYPPAPLYDGAPTTDDLPVVRGGSWGGLRFLARCAFRLRGPPDDRGYNLGFRVVLRSAPVR
jgi:hypothetical protein